MGSKNKKNKSRSLKDKTGSSPNGGNGQVELVVQNTHSIQNMDSELELEKDTEPRPAGLNDSAENMMDPLKGSSPSTSLDQGSKVLNTGHSKSRACREFISSNYSRKLGKRGSKHNQVFRTLALVLLSETTMTCSRKQLSDLNLRLMNLSVNSSKFSMTRIASSIVENLSTLWWQAHHFDVKICYVEYRSCKRLS